MTNKELLQRLSAIAAVCNDILTRKEIVQLQIDLAKSPIEATFVETSTLRELEKK